MSPQPDVRAINGSVRPRPVIIGLSKVDKIKRRKLKHILEVDPIVATVRWIVTFVLLEEFYAMKPLGSVSRALRAGKLA